VFTKNMIYDNIILSCLLSCVIQTHDLIIVYPTLIVSRIYPYLYSIMSFSDSDHHKNMFGVLSKCLSFFYTIYLIFILFIFSYFFFIQII